jgi:hypothetical protein
MILPGMALHRRQLLAGGLALAVPGVARAQNFAIKAPRRDVLTCGVRSAEMKFVEVQEACTFAHSTPLETGAHAVRVALANLGTRPYAVQGVAVCEAGGWRAPNIAAWQQMTFGGAQATTVPAGENPDVPALHWSDWHDLETRGAGRPQLLVRVAMPAQALSLAYVVGPQDYSNLGVGGGRRRIAQAVAPGNHATTALADWPENAANTPYSPVFAIQYRAQRPGIQIVAGGDSHLGAWHTVVMLAALDLSTPELPISPWNVAWPGKPSRQFLPIFDDAVAVANPSIAVLQGWTANDGMNPETDAAYLRAVRQRLARIRSRGAVTITIKAMPRDLDGKPELASWRKVNQELNTTEGPRDLIFNPDPIVEDRSNPGDWVAGFSTDQIHPNETGNQAMKDGLESLMRPLL